MQSRQIQHTYMKTDQLLTTGHMIPQEQKATIIAMIHEFIKTNREILRYFSSLTDTTYTTHDTTHTTHNTQTHTHCTPPYDDHTVTITTRRAFRPCA